MKKDSINPLKLLAMLFVVSGLIFVSSCDDDDDPECDTKTTFYEDADGDGLGDANSSVEECEQPEGYVTNANDDDDTSAPSQTIAEIAAGNSDLSDLVSFVSADEELNNIITGSTNYTVFAPNNAAFEKLRVTLGVESLDQVAPSIIGSVLRFHFHQGVVYADDFGDPLSTIQGEQIAFGESANLGTVITTGGSDTEVEILATNINATNGVVHVVETILIPPTIFISIGQNLGKLSQPLLLSSDFSDVAGLIALADGEDGANVPMGETAIAAVLADSENSYTVFAPTNEVLDGAAAAAGITKDQLIASVAGTPEDARAFLLNHVTSGQIKGSDLSNGSQITMLSGLNLVITEVPVSEQTPTGWILVSPTSGGQYPIYAADVYKATLEDGTELEGATNGSLHVSAPITQ